jgi:predicted nucleic acid-binding protein
MAGVSSMPIVIDASVAIDWFLTKSSEAAEIALDVVAADGAVVPALWRWEVQDVLRRLELAGRLAKSVDFIKTELRELPISVDSELIGLFGGEAALASRYNLTVYDAAYLELALRLGVPLASTDKAIMAAAKTAKVPRPKR